VHGCFSLDRIDRAIFAQCTSLAHYIKIIGSDQREREREIWRALQGRDDSDEKEKIKGRPNEI
jgi:hypothetical protein